MSRHAPGGGGRGLRISRQGQSYTGCPNFKKSWHLSYYCTYCMYHNLIYLLRSLKLSNIEPWLVLGWKDHSELPGAVGQQSIQI